MRLDDPDMADLVARSFHARGVFARRCESLAEARRALAARPRVALLEFSCLDGADALREVVQQWPEAPVVVVADAEDPPWAIEALRDGARGYLLKDDLRTRLPAVLDDVLAGRLPLSAGVVGAVLGHIRRGGEAPEEVSLTGAERALLEGLARGLSYEQCTRAAEVSVNTVRTHVRAVYRKLDVCTKTEAVLTALRRGLIELP